MTEKAEVPKEITKEALDLSGQSEKMLTVSKTVLITDDEMYQTGANQLKLVKAKKKEITDSRLAITRPMDAAKKAVMEFFAKPLNFLAEAEKLINSRMVEYVDQKEAVRKAEEDERIRLEAEDAKQKEEEAKQAEKEGDKEVAEEIRQQPAAIIPRARTTKPVATGAHVRETWSAEVTDKMALIKAVVLRQAPADLIDINMVKLNQMARAMKEDLKYPGVEVVCQKGITSR